MVHINLLEISERRDPGVMVLRTTFWTLSGVAVLALALYGLYAFIALRESKMRHERAVSQWERLESDYKRAQRTEQRLEQLTKLASELAAFSNAQTSVSLRLMTLATAIPPQVQLTELVWRNTTVEAETAPAREFELRLAGRAAAEVSDMAVKQIIVALQQSAPPLEFGTVEPGGIKVDPLTLGSLANIFEVHCKLAPRRY